MKSELTKVFVLVLFILSCPVRITTGEELIQAPAAIQISSTVSDGKYSIPEIVEIARLNNIKVIIITDRDLMRWEYGLWPLRNIIKKTVESNSIFKYGIEQYLNEIKKAQARYPDLILIPGVESAPFYYWQGSFFDNSLKIYNWHKHILAIGLEEVEDYQNLPVIGNRKALRLPFRLRNIARLWPILALLVGFVCLKKRRFRYKDLIGRSIGPYSAFWRISGIILIIIGFLFFLNNLLFYDLKFDQYQGDLGIRPYQDFIDYINQKGGLTFWAHPEAENIQTRGKVNIETKQCSGDLIKAREYNGFTIFYEGYKKVGVPGGIWDELLRQYCQGKRQTPIWAIAGLCFDQAGELSNRITALRTMTLIPELSKIAVLEALEKGRMYVIQGKESSHFILDEFVLKDSLTNSYAIMGEEISLKEKPIIQISGHFANGHEEPVKIKLIKDGRIIKTFEVNSPFNISYTDEHSEGAERFYYRLEVQSTGVFLVTNPIFVRKNPAPFTYSKQK